MTEYPDVVRPEFVPQQNKVTASFIQDFLEVEYSPKGSNSRTAEELIIMNWITYLNEIEGK